MTSAVSHDMLTTDEAQLLTSLVSSGSEQTLLRKALVTVGNKAAFTNNQVISELHCLVLSLSLWLVC